MLFLSIVWPGGMSHHGFSQAPSYSYLPDWHHMSQPTLAAIKGSRRVSPNSPCKVEASEAAGEAVSNTVRSESSAAIASSKVAEGNLRRKSFAALTAFAYFSASITLRRPQLEHCLRLGLLMRSSNSCPHAKHL